jgi:hypothetical protein
MPCKAVAASFGGKDEFSAVGEIARREGFIFVLGWYRVVSGVQVNNTSVWVRGF